MFARHRARSCCRHLPRLSTESSEGTKMAPRCSRIRSEDQGVEGLSGEINMIAFPPQTLSRKLCNLNQGHPADIFLLTSGQRALFLCNPRRSQDNLFWLPHERNLRRSGVYCRSLRLSGQHQAVKPSAGWYRATTGSGCPPPSGRQRAVDHVRLLVPIRAIRLRPMVGTTAAGPFSPNWPQASARKFLGVLLMCATRS